MSYLTVEASTQSGAPVFLYQFVAGDEVWRYTSAADAQSYGGYTWEPSPVEHGDVTQSNELAKDSLSLTFPRTDEFASQFLGYPPDFVVSVTIYRLHRDDGEAVVYWKGRVAGTTTKGQEINVECESIFTSLRRPGLRARYQRNCMRVLYTDACGVDMESFAVEDAPTAVVGNAVTVPAAALQDDGYYRGGMLRYGDTLRLITYHSGSTLTLSREIDALTDDFAEAGYGMDYGGSYGGLSVKIYPGCDGARATCNDRFDNLVNFLGFPWIPGTNPFGGSSLV